MVDDTRMPPLGPASIFMVLFYEKLHLLIHCIGSQVIYNVGELSLLRSAAREQKDAGDSYYKVCCSK